MRFTLPKYQYIILCPMSKGFTDTIYEIGSIVHNYIGA